MRNPTSSPKTSPLCVFGIFTSFQRPQRHPKTNVTYPCQPAAPSVLNPCKSKLFIRIMLLINVGNHDLRRWRVSIIHKEQSWKADIWGWHSTNMSSEPRFVFKITRIDYDLYTIMKSLVYIQIRWAYHISVWINVGWYNLPKNRLFTVRINERKRRGLDENQFQYNAFDTSIT